MRIGPIVREREGPGPTLYISSRVVITGPFSCLTTFRSADRGGSSGTFRAGAVALAVLSWQDICAPVITTVAPTTALRIRKVRRSTPGGIAAESNWSGGPSGSSRSGSHGCSIERSLSSDISFSFLNIMDLLTFINGVAVGLPCFAHHLSELEKSFEKLYLNPN